MGARNPESPGNTTKRKGKKAAPREANCRLKINRETPRPGFAVLAEDELRFHTGRTGREGKDFSVHVRYEDMRELEVDAQNGNLWFTTVEGQKMFFEIGRHAAEWKRMIDERPTPLDALDLKPGMRVALERVVVEGELLEAVAAMAVEGDNLDVLVFGAEHKADLTQLTAAARRVKPGGGVIWVLYTEGSRTISDPDIIAAGRTAGLVSAGAFEISRTQSAVKLTRTGP
jgi:hypothetical protein